MKPKSGCFGTEINAQPRKNYQMQHHNSKAKADTRYNNAAQFNSKQNTIEFKETTLV